MVVLLASEQLVNTKEVGFISLKGIASKSHSSQGKTVDTVVEACHKFHRGSG